MTEDDAVAAAASAATERGYDLADYSFGSRKTEEGTWVFFYTYTPEPAVHWFEVIVDDNSGETTIRGWPPIGTEEPAPPDPSTWPTTLEEAVDTLITELSDADKALLRNTAEKDLIRFHRGWGRAIRNGMGLWGGNRLLMESCGSTHPDSASSVIIHAVWQECRLDTPT